MPTSRSEPALSGRYRLLLNYISLFLILFAVLVIIVGIVVVHKLPGKIAEQRRHPQIDAIKIMSYLGLIVFPLWMFALIRGISDQLLCAPIEED
jgi:uncharacterized membrane protein